MAAEGSLTTRLSLDVQLIQDGVGMFFTFYSHLFIYLFI